MLNQREKQKLFKERTERLESIQENLKEAASTVEALKIEREMLKESLKVAFNRSLGEEQSKEYWKKIKEMDYKIENIEKMVKESRANNEKEKYLRPEPAKKQRFLEDESNSEVHSALTESMYTLIEKTRLNPLRSLFKEHFICSKRLKSSLETRKYKEVLLHLFDFTLSVLDYLLENSSFADSYSTKNGPVPYKPDTKPSYFNNTQRKFQSANEMSSFCRPTPDFNISQNYTQTCWTQTVPAFIETSQTTKGSQTAEKPYGNFMRKKLASAGVQADNCSFKLNPNENLMKSGSASRDRDFKPEYFSETSTDRVNMLIESRMADQDNEGITKLFDESQQLLDIIDKQNSRLARINKQILSFAPKPENFEDEDSTESPKRQERLNYFYSKIGKNREKPWNSDFMPKKPQHSAHSSENIQQVKHFSEAPDEESLKKAQKKADFSSRLPENLENRLNHKSEPKFSKVYERGSKKSPRSLIENPRNYGYQKVFRYKPNEISDDLGSFRTTPPHERRKYGLESSALRIPSKDNSRINESGLREVSSPRVLSPQSPSRVASPSRDRFGGYTRPFLRQEKSWKGVRDYFSNHN